MNLKSRLKIVSPVILLLCTHWFPGTSLAAGPLDAEVGLTWWAHDITAPGVNSTTADGPGAYAEIWWAEGWGLGANYFESDPDARGLADTSGFSVDLKRRFISPTENNFLALGAGWQNVDLVRGGSADGVRLLAEGRFGVGILFGYGHAAWMPDLGDAGLHRDVEGTEYEVGVSLTPFPFLNLRLGYRVFDLDFRGGSQESDGYLLGGAVHF